MSKTDITTNEIDENPNKRLSEISGYDKKNDVEKYQEIVLDEIIYNNTNYYIDENESIYDEDGKYVGFRDPVCPKKIIFFNDIKKMLNN